MKKIINKKLYDTETATWLAGWDNGYFGGDCHLAIERLYRKRTGEYFLNCEGGGWSEYGERWGNDWVYGEHIIPLTLEQAQKWAEEKLEVSEYAEIFGMPEEDESQSVRTITLPASMVEALQQDAEKAGLSLIDYVGSITSKNYKPKVTKN